MSFHTHLDLTWLAGRARRSGRQHLLSVEGVFRPRFTHMEHGDGRCGILDVDAVDIGRSEVAVAECRRANHF